MNDTEDFGAYLRHERELRGVALEDIADATKIHLRYLEALESNLYDELPGEVFVKGYIRSYAKSIGSNVEEMINTYDDSVGRDRLKTIDVNKGGGKDGAFIKPVWSFIIIGLILAGLAYGGMFVTEKISQNETGKFPQAEIQPQQPEVKPIKTTDSPASGVEKQKILPPITAPSELQNPASEGEISEGFTEIFDHPNKPEGVAVGTDKSPLEQVPEAEEVKKLSTSTEKGVIIQSVVEKSGSEGAAEGGFSLAEPPALKLRVFAKGNSWYNLAVDNYREEDFILSEGTEKIFSGNEMFRITIGSRGSTDLFLNNQPLDLPEGSGEVIRDFIINSSLLE